MSVGIIKDKKATYPVEYFPQIMRNAIESVVRDVQAPPELVGTAILGIASLALQGLKKIRYPDGRVRPLSLYLTVIADSGERKTAVYNLVGQPVFAFEKACRKKHEMLIVDYNAELQSWKVQEQSILKSIRKKTEKGVSIESENERLKLHYRIKPKSPVLPKMIYNDTTPEALQSGLYNNIPSASLMSDEAGVFFKGRAKSNLGFLNQLWDGSSFDVERKTGSFTVDDCMFTILLMIQTDEFEKYVKKQGDYAVGSGFFSRFMITGVTSMQGRRDTKTVQNAGGDSLRLFHEKIEEALSSFEEMCNSGTVTHDYYTLSEQAQTALSEYQKKAEDAIIQHKDKSPLFEGMFSKFSENLIRVAALFEYFDGDNSGVISSKNVVNASKIVIFYYSYLLTSGGLRSETVDQNADLLYAWLVSRKDNYYSYTTHINKMEIRRKGPYKLRNKIKLNAALEFLEQEGKVGIQKLRNNNGTMGETIVINR